MKYGIRRTFQKLAVFFCSLLFVLYAIFTPQHFAIAAENSNSQSNSQPNLTAQSAILIDLKTGQVLYAKNPNDRHYPASITKILTAILALEHSKLSDQVTTSKLATEQDGNRVYLVTGEQESMEQILYGLLLNSGNDAAVAIAEHVAGSVPAFADMMNAKAKQIGATNSHFVTPNGLHDPNHYTTAHDMALIARYAMRIPEFRKLVSTKYYDWHGQEWNSTLVNLNRLLWTYNGITGIKTGYTDQAQQTSVVSATRGNTSILAVLLDIRGLNQARQESADLLDYGFKTFYNTKIAAKGQVATTLQINDTEIPIVTARDTWYDVQYGEKPNIHTTFRLKALKPPFKAGRDAGMLEFWDGKTLIAQTPLIAAKDLSLPTTEPWYKNNGSYAAAVFLLVLFFVTRYRRQKRKQVITQKATEM